jgi:hypothetical protein
VGSTQIKKLVSLANFPQVARLSLHLYTIHLRRKFISSRCNRFLRPPTYYYSSDPDASDVGHLQLYIISWLRIHILGHIHDVVLSARRILARGENDTKLLVSVQQSRITVSIVEHRGRYTSRRRRRGHVRCDIMVRKRCAREEEVFELRAAVHAP